MAAGQIKSNYWLDPDKKEYIASQASASGMSASEFIDMLIQMYRNIEAGRIIVHQVGAPCPYLERLQRFVSSAPSPRN